MNRAVAQFGFTILMFILFVYSAIEATSFKKLAKYFPLYISIIAAIILFIEIVKQGIQLKKNVKKGEVLHPNLRGAIKYGLILTVYIAMVYLIGLILASAIYVFLFLYFIAEMKLIQSLIAITVLTVLLITFGNVMNLYWPKSLLNIFMIT